MGLAFLDTSAVVKLYVRERGSAWIRRFVKKQKIVISELTLFEIITVLRRRHSEGEFTEKQARILINRILNDVLTFEVIKLGGNTQVDALLAQSFSLPVMLRLRALDGILMIAAAEALDFAKNSVPPEPFTFISSDVQFLRVMQHQGYTVENPEDHP
jgi:predicted nucleic acid-binding protein